MPSQATQRSSSYTIDAPRIVAVSVLFFLSGTAGLILQVVWMYRLGLVFGNVAYATAATLAAFFLGLAIGGWFLGSASTKFRRSLSFYGLIEIGIALSALLLIPGLEFYKTSYASIAEMIGEHRGLLIFSKFIFSTTLLLLPTILMGGTFPVLAQYIGKSRRELEIRGTFLYALNTIGAATGALLTGFFLLSKYGVNTTYYIGVTLAAGIGVTALILDWLPTKGNLTTKESETLSPGARSTSSDKSSSTLSYPLMVILAFSSGLLALSAETLWIRMFAQVLQNSVYSFSAVLGVFLIALGFGGLLSHFLVRLSLRPIPVLLALLCGSIITTGLSPIIFSAVTDGLRYVAADESWPKYLKSVFGLSALVVFPPTVIIGTVFPYLLKAAPTLQQEPGLFVGKLVLFNAIGSTVGPILVGFFALDALGLWSSLKIVAIIYGGLAFWVIITSSLHRKWYWSALPAVIIVGIMALKNPQSAHLEKGENLLATWQASDGVVSVVKSKENIQMRLDNYYVLGDTRTVLVEQMQGHIPLLIHPAPKHTLFLGMGTGITAGASLNHEVDSVIAVELVPNVIRAAKRYFSPLTNGLFQDPRVKIIADDARNYLLGTSENFDVIVGDLFTPWHAGTGSLYTIEHFQQVKKRLAPRGIFAQWLPMYQLTPESFKTIAVTFASVFPEVTLWRADFSGSRASVALIGQQAGAKLDQETLEQNIIHVIGSQNSSENEHMTGLFYLGNLDALQNYLSGVELNTDNNRTIEFTAPIQTQQANAGSETYLVGKELDRLLTVLAENLPAEQDPYLSDLPASEIRYVKAGRQYYRYLQLSASGKTNKADSVLSKIQELAPAFLEAQSNQ